MVCSNPRISVSVDQTSSLPAARSLSLVQPADQWEAGEARRDHCRGHVQQFVHKRAALLKSRGETPLCLNQSGLFCWTCSKSLVFLPQRVHPQLARLAEFAPGDGCTCFFCLLLRLCGLHRWDMQLLQLNVHKITLWVTNQRVCELICTQIIDTCGLCTKACCHSDCRFAKIYFSPWIIACDSLSCMHAGYIYKPCCFRSEPAQSYRYPPANRRVALHVAQATFSSAVSFWNAPQI